MVLKNERGQTMVEYILLLAVAISLIFTFYNSEVYKKFFGQNGRIAGRIQGNTEFSYRHAYVNTKNEPRGYYGDEGYTKDAKTDPARHPSYHQPGEDTRFFGPQEVYP